MERKGRLQVLGDIRGGHHQTNGDEKKKKKSTADEWENFSQPNSAAEILSKG